MKFSFLSDTLLSIANCCRSLFPMASRLVAVEYGNSQYRVLSMQKNSYEISEQEDVPNNENFRIMLNSSKESLWCMEDELPFSVDSKSLKQSFDLFDEHNRNILQLRQKYNNLDYFVFVYFNQSMQHFMLIGDNGQKSDNGKFTNENKNIIGQMAVNSLRTFLNTMTEDLTVFDQVKSAMNSMVIQQKTNNNGQSSEIKLLENMIVEMASEYLNNLSHEYEVKLVLSPSSEKRISTFRGQPSALRRILKQAAVLAVNMNNQKNKVVIIEDYFIINVHENEDLTNNVEEQGEVESTVIHHRYVKTYQMLDRFEEAVRTALLRGQSVTGVNVGSNLNPSISAPAISDALKKHGPKIVSLMNEYPDKWNALRQHFKPVQNIIISVSSNTQSA